MNKYLWAHCFQDYWPEIKTIMAKSYNDAVEKIISLYNDKYEDDDVFSSIEDWKSLREYLNEIYSIALSDLEIFEEL